MDRIQRFLGGLSSFHHVQRLKSVTRKLSKKETSSLQFSKTIDATLIGLQIEHMADMARLLVVAVVGVDTGNKMCTRSRRVIILHSILLSIIIWLDHDIIWEKRGVLWKTILWRIFDLTGSYRHKPLMVSLLDRHCFAGEWYHESYRKSYTLLDLLHYTLW